MITINNIHIAYDRILLNNASINLAPGKITVIEGVSGSGKTSLLYLVGLIKKDDYINYNYENNIINLNDNQAVSDIRKSQIGVVLQENNFIEHLSIYDNLLLYAKIANKKITQTEAKNVLSSVDLKMDLNSSVEHLSGGEKQRLAIACALIKNPYLLILDEPTSALDSENALIIMKILKEIAKKGKIVLLTSHDKNIVNMCDIVYKIENQKLILKNNFDLENIKLSINKKKGLSIDFYLFYSLSYFKRYKISICALLFSLGIVISLITGIPSLSKSFEKSQIKILNDIANCEMLVTSKTNDSNIVKYDTNLPNIDRIKIKNIESSENCLSVYPYYQGYSTYITYGDTDFDLYCTIQPYTEQRNIRNIAEAVFADENNIFISYSLYEKIGAQSTKTQFKCNFILPSQDEITINGVISGVIDKRYQDLYSSDGYIIYVPYDFLPQLEDIQALLVYAKDFKAVPLLKEEIKKIDSDFGILNEVIRMEYLSSAIDIINTISPFVMGMLITISIALVVVVYVRYIANRKLEVCLLKINGLSNREIIKLITLELIVQIIGISVISYISLFLISIVTDFYLKLILSFNKVSVILLAVMFTFPPSFISLLVFYKQDPIDLLRN